MNNEMIEIHDAEVMDTNQMGGAIQTRTAYTTAMQIIKPRNLATVENRALQEAAIAGDEFYYSWSQGGSLIEGLTVGAAMSIARNMGNCAVPVTVEETKDTYIFTATFIDLETGFNLQRSYRQNKQSPKKRNGKDIYEGERGADIIFQIGQSKAIRNVVLNAVPNWLSKKVLAKAKENVSGKIEKMGKEKARDMLTKKAASLAIPIETIEAAFGKSAGWDTPKLVQISGAIRGYEDGYISIAEAFPSNDPSPKDEVNAKLTGETTKAEPKEQDDDIQV